MPTFRTLLNQRPLWLGGALAFVAVAVGALLGYTGPLLTVGALGALAVGLWALTSFEVSLWAAIAVITLLPFASLPFKVVFTPTFLDLAFMGLVAVYALQWMLGHRRRLTLTPAHGPLALFLGLAVLSFVAGKDNGPLTTNLLRQFGELLLSISLVFMLTDYLSDSTQVTRLLRVLVLGGVGAAGVALGLYVLPHAVSNQLLSVLGVFGYPSGDVLRFIEDNPAGLQRAIGTSVDPNVLGGLLAIMGGLLAPQLLAQRPVLGNRWLTLGAFGVVVLALILTFSRGAMAALAVALTLLAVVRYRQLLWVLALGAALVLLLPVTQDYVAHFAAGLQGQDLATQMRFGEYKDAFILIERYPVLGVGFAGAPEIDVYLGVSSAYLLMAQQMGLVGLSAFLLVMATVYGWALVRRRALLAHPTLAPLALGAHTALLAALVVGIADHYFFQLSFQPAGALFWLLVSLCLATTRLSGTPMLVENVPTGSS